MNYRHAFHAGNHADLLKHAVLVLALKLLTQKAKPLTAIDLFAGAGLYDLILDERADRTGEWRSGVDQLWRNRDNPRLAPLSPLLEQLEAQNEHENTLRFYPGSPLLMRAALRSDDKLMVVEKHPEECAALERRIGKDHRCRVYAEDGWAALRSFLPPTPRRGLVMIDPPFEARGEFDRMATALGAGLRRWASGVFLLWYPIKTGFDAVDWARKLTSLSGESALLETALHIAPEGRQGLIGSGMIIANPPFGFAEEAHEIGAALAGLLAEAGAAGYRQAWLRAPR